MTYTIQEKYNLIKSELANQSSIDPIEIARSIMRKDFINIHGPEHHFLDGASLMKAMNNAGLNFDFDKALSIFAERSIKMPGAMCGFWGVCGSITSVAAVFAILEGTGPLSTDESYSSHMEFTSKVISKMSEIGGPRCCKRNAFISLIEGIKYANEKFGLNLPINNIKCIFSSFNNDCLKEKCPFFLKK